MPKDFFRLEAQVLDLLLAGDDPRIAVLREQRRVCRVKSRELTGVGFFTYLDVPAEAPRVDLIAHQMTLTGVHAEIDGLAHGAGFVLFVVDGVLDNLEGFSYDDAWWVDDGDSFTLDYGGDGKPPSLS